MTTPGQPRDVLAALFWAAVGALAAGMMVPLEPSMLEEGYIIHIAQRMAAGDHLYRDIVTFTGPFPFELLAALFRVFGERIEVARAAVVVMHALASAAAYAVARRSGAGQLAHPAALCIATTPVLLFPLYSLFFYTTMSVHLCFITGYAALRAARSSGWGLATGLLIATVALSKQTVGVVLAVGLIPAVFAAAPSGRRTRAAAAVAAGGLLAAVATLGLYAARGDVADLYRNLVVLPLSLSETFDAPYLNLWPPGVLSVEIQKHWAMYLPYIYGLFSGVFVEPGVWIVLLTQVLYALPFAAVLLTLVAALRRKLPPELWVHTALFVAAASNLFPRTDWGHLVFAIPASIAQLLVVLGTAPLARTRARRVVGTTLVGLLVVALSVGAIVQGALLRRISSPPSFGPLVAQRPISRIYRGDVVPRVIRYIRERVEPGHPIFVPRSEPLIYFATETTNPTPYGGVITGFQEEQQAAILAGLADVDYVVMSEIDQPIFTYYGDELPDVSDYFERYFRVPERFTLKPSWLIVLDRAGDRGETVIDFFRERDRGHRFIRNARGAEKAPSVEPVRVPATQNRRPLIVALGPLGGGIDFVVDIPENAVLQTDFGLDDFVGKYIHPRHTSLHISLAREGGEFEEIAAMDVLTKEHEGRRWRTLEVALDAFAGQRVTLRLELASKRRIEPEQFTWFGSPRIALRPKP